MGFSHPFGFIRALPALVPLPKTGGGRAAVVLGVGAAAVLARSRSGPPAAASSTGAVASAPPPRVSADGTEGVAKPARKGARRGKRRSSIPLAIGLILLAAALTAPWVTPGFSQWVRGWTDGKAAPARITVADPVVAPQAPPASVAPPLLSGVLTAAGVPTRVVVPRLQVNAPVVPISGNSGTLIPPSDPQTIGWWEEGSRPGEAAGTTILTGHTVHYGGGAFDSLSSLAAGDYFQIRTAKGLITYVVLDVHTYLTGELARQSAVIFRLTGPPRVLLVTCSQWNGTIYLDNTVVTGAPVSVS